VEQVITELGQIVIFTSAQTLDAHLDTIFEAMPTISLLQFKIRPVRMAADRACMAVPSHQNILESYPPPNCH